MKSINTRIWICLSLLFTLILGEIMITNPVDPQAPILSQSKQGIAGKVLRLKGNQMPTIDSSVKRNSPEFIRTSVWIFTGRIPASNIRWPIVKAQKHPSLLRQIHSNKNGEFFVELPSGEYTLFPQYDADLYLNAFLADGSYATVYVEKDKVSTVELVNTENAFF
ncbi:MAG: hypothetical protein VKJ02_12735 [Snowella sp.]|nr:hypothetical protein [Snowella sp.]